MSVRVAPEMGLCELTPIAIRPRVHHKCVMQLSEQPRAIARSICASIPPGQTAVGVGVVVVVVDVDTQTGSALRECFTHSWARTTNPTRPDGGRTHANRAPTSARACSTTKKKNAPSYDSHVAFRVRRYNIIAGGAACAEPIAKVCDGGGGTHACARCAPMWRL